MKLLHATTGDLEKFFKEERVDGEWAVTHGTREAAEDTLFDLRQDVISGGLGARLSKSWRVAHYPAGNKVSLSAASVIKTKSPKLIRAFDEGATIRSQEGFWIAVPTDAAPKKGLGRKRITPSNFPENRYGPLRFVYRTKGPSLLVVDNQRERKGKRGGYALAGKRARASGYGVQTVVMFTLHRQVRLKRRLNVDAAMGNPSLRMLRAIDSAYRRRDRRKGRS